MYAVLDVAFLVFHTLLVAFNIAGWMWRKTRRIHLAVISLTVLSWFGLGIFYGWGYCPCTDWHWQVKRQLGETNLPASYVKYYLDALTGKSWETAFVDVAVAAIGLAAFVISVFVNWRDWKRGRKAS